jgi:hypothetical protein
MEVLNSQLRKILAEQVARASDRKALLCNIPFMLPYAVTKWIYILLS